MSTPGDYAKRWKNEGLKGWENIYELTIRSSYEAFRPWFSQQDTAMELGCGDGGNTQRIVTDFKQTVVIDFSAEFLEMARYRLDCQGLDQGNVCYVCSRVEEFSMAAVRAKFGVLEKFDAIFAMHILEHVEDPVGVLAAYKQYLRPEGYIFITVPNAQSFHRQLGVAMGLLESEAALSDQDRFLGHSRVYCMESLKGHLEAAGLEYGRIRGNFLKPLSARQMNDWDPAILEGLEKLGMQHPGMAADLCVAAWLPETYRW